MKYTKEVLEEAVAKSQSVAGVLRCLGLNQTGGSHAHISRRIKAFGIDTSHFCRPKVNGAARRRHKAEQILIRVPPGGKRQAPHMLRRALVEIGRAYQCARCGIADWNDWHITLEVDHIDGDYRNNEAWNLRFLCPNCHSQTDNYAGRARGCYEEEGQLLLFRSVYVPYIVMEGTLTVAATRMSDPARVVERQTRRL
jgi:5-methylcytosine-specific restriction endonuclease McrA